MSRPTLALRDKPSIAVLPFANMSGDPEQEYFADGMVEEIVTALSRIRWLFVIARNSSFTCKGRAVDVKQVGRELGYILEGSVRKGGGRVRVTAQLIEAETGVHLWAERFDGSLEDVFDLQDKVALSVAGVIELALQADEMRRSAERPTADLTAYDLYLRGYAMASSSAARFPEALALLQQAIERDPDYGPALAYASVCCLRLCMDARTGEPEAATLGCALFLGRRFDEAVPKLLLQIRDDPTNQGTYRLLAACYAHMGKLDEARKVIERLRAITAVVIPDASFLRNPENRELFLSGLRLAVGEERLDENFD